MLVLVALSVTRIMHFFLKELLPSLNHEFLNKQLSVNHEFHTRVERKKIITEVLIMYYLQIGRKWTLLS
jgi:hypothetical protein